MKKLIRLLLLGIVAGIAFLVAIVAIFLAVFDANAYKDDLAELVREQTGRDLEFIGDVSLTVYPALGMKLGAMRFSNPPSFGGQPMVKVEAASISVDLASLITMTPEIDKLVLRDLDIFLVRNEAGVTNWDDLVPAEKPAAPGADSGAEPTGEAAGGMSLRGAFGGLDLQNIRLVWLDKQAGSEFRITDLDISTGRIEPNKPFPLALSLDASAAGDIDVDIDLETDVEYLIDRQQLTLESLSLGLNRFRLDGRVQLTGFAQPVLRFDLESEELNVDALLAASGFGESDNLEAAGTSAGGPPEDTPIELPMETLRGLDIDGRLAIAQMQLQNLKMSDVRLALKARDGIVELGPITMDSYSGTVEVAASIDVRGAIPVYRVSKKIDGVEVGGMLVDYAALDTIAGALSADVEVTTRGESVRQLRANSDGRMKLAVLDGALKGVNIRHSIEAAKARVRGEPAPPRQDLKTDFSSLTLSGEIARGIFSSKDLDLQAPLLRARGSGSANLVDNTINYLINTKLVGSTEGQQGKAGDELAGLEIPVSIKGPFAAPKIDVLLDEMLKARADAEKARLKGEIEAQKRAVEEALEAEKKALEESRRREIEKRKEIERAKLEQKKQEKKDELLKKLLD